MLIFINSSKLLPTYIGLNFSASFLLTKIPSSSPPCCPDGGVFFPPEPSPLPPCAPDPLADCCDDDPCPCCPDDEAPFPLVDEPLLPCAPAPLPVCDDELCCPNEAPLLPLVDAPLPFCAPPVCVDELFLPCSPIAFELSPSSTIVDKLGFFEAPPPLVPFVFTKTT